MFVENVTNHPKLIVGWQYNDKITKCTIRIATEKGSKEDGVIVASDVALCNDSDNFCKNKGRKISMNRALRAFPVEERKKFWKAYFEMRGEKW